MYGFVKYTITALLLFFGGLALLGCSTNCTPGNCYELVEGDSRRHMLWSKGPEEASEWYQGVSNDDVCNDWAVTRARFDRGFGGRSYVDNIDANMKFITAQRGFTCVMRGRTEKASNTVPQGTPTPPTSSNNANDYQRLKNLNDYLQSLPGGLNHNQPKSCPWLASQSSDGMNTYCIYECTDGSTKTVTQIAGMGCI